MIDSASDNEDNKDNKGKYFSLFNTIINARKFNIEILVSTFTEKGRNRAIERTQKVIRCYYLFGKELKSHFDKLKELARKPAKREKSRGSRRNKSRGERSSHLYRIKNRARVQECKDIKSFFNSSNIILGQSLGNMIDKDIFY
ncbi:unnamed protein product [Rhizophagus irregularis]|nr:unnamed protein product [Rhizophagus irregularis]